MDAQTVAQFTIATLLPGAATAALTSLRKGRAQSIGSLQWQVICGIVFGIIAILGTEFGIPTVDAVMNVRDAAPIAAGLFFGGPAGIIAGTIGGVERWFAALWGRGEFTQLACSIGTFASGVYAALVSRYVLEKRRPTWSMAMGVGTVAEVLHLLLIFLTNFDSPVRAFTVVRACTVPMIGCNSIAAALSAIAAHYSAGKVESDRSEAPDIPQLMRRHLLWVTTICFAVTALFAYLQQSSISRTQTDKLLSSTLSDTRVDIDKASNDNLIDLTKRAAEAIPDLASATQSTIDELVDKLDVSEIHVINEQGIIVASSDQHLVGYDMASGEQSAEFLILLPGGGAAQFVQDYQPMSADASAWRKYAGVRIRDGFVQVGYDADHFLEDLTERIDNSVRNRHVGQGGALVVTTSDGHVVSTRADLVLVDEDVAVLANAAQTHPERESFTCTFLGTEWYVSHCTVEGYRLFALQPVDEAQLERDLSLLILAYMGTLVFAALYVAVYLIIRHEVVESVRRVNATLDTIAQGNLEAEVNVRNNAEFISLSDDINTVVAYLRDAIAAEATRLDQDLEYARLIQESALPRTFPPFPEIQAFDIYANMDPAREVGGDFYDFFLVDDHTLGFLIADVSGKGIPASLFMMAAKAEISSYMTSGMSLVDAVQTANWYLCQGNDAAMFVTVWAALLDYDTGELTYVNAGHNHPLLRHDGEWQWLDKRSGLLLGTFDTAQYRSFTLQLEPGDELLLYTDGVNEAFSAEGEQYGNDRLEAFLTSHASMHPHALVDALSADVSRWATGAEQSDDITILSLEYGVSPQDAGRITVPAQVEELTSVLNYIHETLHNRSCPLTVQHQLDIVIEELFVNICKYGYPDQDEIGEVTIEYTYSANPSAITVCMTDSGIPFNPLDHLDPVRPTSIDEVKIGGLGIYMSKRMTDDLSYIRDGDQNVVAFVKKW